MIESIATKIAAVAVSFALGFSTGYYIKIKLCQAAQFQQVEKTLQQSAVNVVKGIEKSQEVEAAVQQSNTNINQIQEAVAKRLAQPKGKSHAATHPNVHTTPAASSDEVNPQSGDIDRPDVLDVGTVRLLNAARRGDSLESTGIGAD